MPGNDLVFYGTTGTGGGFDGDAQSDPTMYLGRFRSSTRLDEFQSTLTVSQAALPRARNILIDATRIGDGADAHALKWMLIQTGPAALFASRIMAFDDATGRFKLENRTPAAAVAGDDYAVFDVNNVWPDVTVPQAAAGEERFRCISFRNQHGAGITNVKVYFQAIGLNGSGMSRLHQVASPLLQPFIQRADDVTDVLNSFGQRDPLGGPDNFLGSGGWINPHTRAIADTVATSVMNNESVAIWMRRTIPPGLRFRRSVAIMVIAESDTGGSDPDPLAGACILPYNIDGLTPVADLTLDRIIHIGGGARMNGLVTVNGTPLADRPVRFGLRPTDEGTIITDDDPAPDFDTTDDQGRAFGTFKSTENPAFEGVDTHPQLIVGAGGEVGDP